MLNRRILRIKAMQNLYALYLCKKSNYNSAIGLIESAFNTTNTTPHEDDQEQPSLEPEQTEADKKEAINSFKEQVDKKIPTQQNISAHIKDLTAKAVNSYNTQNQKDTTFIFKEMVREAEKLHSQYLLILLLLVEFSRQATNEKQKGVIVKSENNFSKNRVIHLISNHTSFRTQLQDKSLDWKKHSGLVREWYRMFIKKNNKFIDYQSGKDTTFKQDKDIIKYILKSIIFKNDTIQLFMEENDLRWNENSKVLKSMLFHTIKNIEEEKKSFELLSISNNWEEDKAFFTKLFDLTVKNEEYYQQLIIDKVKNWDIERLALIDKVIIKMALCELTNFPSIPIKVTINEYIEISKSYSTPKSRQFVNGLLDVMANELRTTGHIKKSGKGLIDNK